MAAVTNRALRSDPSSYTKPIIQSSSNTDKAMREVLFVGFNQDYGCVACGTDRGFRLYSCEPFTENLRRELNIGGIGIVEMLFRTNLMAFVGGGSNPRYPPNKVMIWDDVQGRCIGELSFRAQVRAVKLRSDKIVVVLEHKIFVYILAELKLIHQIETMANSRGLSALSTSSNNAVLACPGLHRGQVRVEHLSTMKTKFIEAHDSHLACFALTADGQRLATASKKGTLVRIFNTLDGTRLQELRRGADRAQIYSLAFSANAQWLALSSDKGTVHVFGLRPFTTKDNRGVDVGPLASNEDENGMGNNNGVSNASANSNSFAFLASNPGSSLAFMKGVLPSYFSSEWSFAQFHLPEETQAIVAFGAQKNTVIIVGTDGSFYKCGFDPLHGGEMVQQEFIKFVRPNEDEPQS